MRVATRPEGRNSPWRSAARAWSETPGATATSAADGRALAPNCSRTPPAAITSGLPPNSPGPSNAVASARMPATVLGSWRPVPGSVTVRVSPGRQTVPPVPLSS